MSSVEHRDRVGGPFGWGGWWVWSSWEIFVGGIFGGKFWDPGDQEEVIGNWGEVVSG